ncbi:MAG: DUF493 family protein [Bacteriovoracaceae bacterium]
MSYSDHLVRMKELLDQQYTWPDKYMFKFIVPGGKEDEVKTLADVTSAQFRPSRSGKYVSMTFEKSIESSDEVIEIYKRLSKIEGIVSL